VGAAESDARGSSEASLAPLSCGHIDDVDLLRARHYDLLAVLLGRAPDQPLLNRLAALQGDGSVLGRLTTNLARAAAQTSAGEAEREFFNLFIGVGRGELLPFASYYLTGFLNERPLARVRGDLAALKIEREDGASDPEDHIAFLFEAMAGMAAGRFAVGPGEEQRFFDRHLQPWAGRFLADLEAAKTARFYRAVGGLGRAFVEIETEAFALDA
jgi:TorA maturation chaperone TorD